VVSAAREVGEDAIQQLRIAQEVERLLAVLAGGLTATPAAAIDALPKRDQEALLRTIDAFISKTD